ncbi:MAG: argininosuccinate lyase [Actinomycetota bacterium]|nr:argininosuccinate lyase [Actinomycetota bacterium]
MTQGSEQGHKALWGGRFEGHPERFTQEFGASLEIDKRIWTDDIAGSIAHAHMLGKQGIIPAGDVEAIVAGLKRIAGEIERGEFVFDPDDEDIHMAIESQLTAEIGEAGGRLHTGRSRNDQVATDMHHCAKRLALSCMYSLLALRGTLVRIAEDHFGVVMPGYTHLQKAQPVLFSHHILAYYWMFTRDFKRFHDAYDAADELVLGSAALAGTTYPLDRQAVADELGFSSISENSLDAVSNRDYLLDLLYACSVTAMHLSRLCEEIILWSTDEFGFIRLDDAYSTGSSIMPQKKNPDFAELIRGKTGRVYGDLVGLLTVMKSLPLAYDKDMQEDKEGVFDAVDTISDCLRCTEGMVSTMQVRADRMRQGAQGGFMAATDLADYLVGQGVPFRRAHEIVGELVLACEKQGRTLQSLSAAELAAHAAEFGEGACDAVDIDRVVACRTTAGGTGHDVVRTQLEHAAARLEGDRRLAVGLG